MLNAPMGPALALSAFVLALLYRVTVLLLPPAAAISRLLSSLGLKAMCQVSEAGVSIICTMGKACDISGRASCQAALWEAAVSTKLLSQGLPHDYTRQPRQTCAVSWFCMLHTLQASA